MLVSPVARFHQLEPIKSLLHFAEPLVSWSCIQLKFWDWCTLPTWIELSYFLIDDKASLSAVHSSLNSNKRLIILRTIWTYQGYGSQSLRSVLRLWSWVKRTRCPRLSTDYDHWRECHHLNWNHRSYSLGKDQSSNRDSTNIFNSSYIRSPDRWHSSYHLVLFHHGVISLTVRNEIRNVMSYTK